MKPNKNFSMSLIDGDIIAYRCSISAQDESSQVCCDRVNDLIEYCLDQTVGFALEGNYKVYLTGKDNFRYDLAKTHTYKGNRKETVKPLHLEAARKFLQDTWGAKVIHTAEADDAIATDMTNYGDKAVCVSIDKDFNTVKGWKYNFVKDEWRYDDDWSAAKYFYTQILTGDAVDNIVGLYRVGPKTAEKILKDCTTESELWEACIKAYDGDYERVLENARLLHLRRYEGELWEPPKED